MAERRSTDDKITKVFAKQQSTKWKVKQSTSAERAQKLAQLREAIAESEEQVCEALYDDLRKPRSHAKAEIAGCLTDIDDAIEHLDEWMRDIPVEPSEQFAGANAKITYEARGIVLLFGAWNFPFSLIFQPLVPIIAAGNCAIIKPNEMSPATSRVTAKIIGDVFHDGEVCAVEGGVELANELLRFPFDHIFFTGSPAVGKTVMTAAAKHLASVTLELGGKNPVVIDKTADIADAAKKVAMMRTMNSGQVCLCPENVWVPHNLLDEFLSEVSRTFAQRFYENGDPKWVAIGKIVDKKNWRRVVGYIEDAKGKGAHIACGGGSDEEQLVVEPTVLTNVPNTARIVSEETFGRDFVGFRL